MNYDKINLFSENFDMKYVLEEIEKNFDKRKHLLCDINNVVLNSERKKKFIDNYEEKLIDKQIKIIINTKMNYKKLNNINYVKYYLPYCIQPKTNNTNLCLTKNIHNKNTKQSILRELNTKKKEVEFKIKHFIKKYTGRYKKKSILHKQISQLFKEKSKIELYIKNKKNTKINFNKVIGDIAFFDHNINLLLENVIFNSCSIIFIKKYT
ncbi:conserved Plasmodium protein, unknown function [Plasmodium gallinaceum]|uniref:Uncharacterized protein n=1 Tax=Plasmodium gallinaceum TaxID=5849 RepID=A0A1J1GWA9_PLAGA|nr:conserved Plasmodium protein, unknown function [Plasmodium gallinaceum]CRG96758.1 conserved Plasmodium protein, unknown function [Plasmodium gallinaceum]